MFRFLHSTRVDKFTIVFLVFLCIYDIFNTTYLYVVMIYLFNCTDVRIKSLTS